MRLWVNEDRTLLVRLFDDDGTLEVAIRERPGDTWGPPIIVVEENAEADQFPPWEMP